MEVKEAIERAKNSKDVKKLKNYFICSCFACINDSKKEITEWTLLFYNPEKKVVLDCFVNDKFVTLGEETPPMSEIKKPSLDGLKVTAEDALGTVLKNFKKSTINVLITLHKNPLVWTINMITKDMMATTFDVDASTGKVLREEETSLIRKL